MLGGLTNANTVEAALVGLKLKQAHCPAKAVAKRTSRIRSQLYSSNGEFKPRSKQSKNERNESGLVAFAVTLQTKMIFQQLLIYQRAGSARENALEKR